MLRLREVFLAEGRLLLSRPLDCTAQADEALSLQRAADAGAPIEALRQEWEEEGEESD